MVNTRQTPPTSHPILQSVVASLQQLAHHSLTSQRFVQLAEDFYWSLIEGQYRNDSTAAANQLRETLSDITAQWELLLGNWHDRSPSTSTPEFPAKWVQQWLEQIQSIEQVPMPEMPKNQSTFHINQVGNLNTGDVTIAGDQIGIQHNDAPPQKLAEAAKEIQQLLAQLAQTYPTATEAEASNLMQAELAKIEQIQPQRWAILRRDLLNQERWFQGGKAAVTEMAKQLADQSVLVKGAIAFLEKFSQDLD